MLQQNEMFRPSNLADANRQILGQVLRGIDIEYKRTSTSIHLASADAAQVDSLLLALDQIIKTHAAVQSHLDNETSRAAAPNLLAQLVAEVRTVRDGLWPEYYRSCEALTRLLDTLELAHQMLTAKTASATPLICES